MDLRGRQNRCVRHMFQQVAAIRYGERAVGGKATGLSQSRRSVTVGQRGFGSVDLVEQALSVRCGPAGQILVS